MPNSQNRNSGGSNRESGKGQPKDRTQNAAAPKPNPERSDLKQNDGGNRQGSTDRTSNQGRKRASGGSAED